MTSRKLDCPDLRTVPTSRDAPPNNLLKESRLLDPIDGFTPYFEEWKHVRPKFFIPTAWHTRLQALMRNEPCLDPPWLYTSSIDPRIATYIPLLRQVREIKREETQSGLLELLEKFVKRGGVSKVRAVAHWWIAWEAPEVLQYLEKLGSGLPPWMYRPIFPCERCSGREDTCFVVSTGLPEVVNGVASCKVDCLDCILEDAPCRFMQPPTADGSTKEVVTSDGTAVFNIPGAIPTLKRNSDDPQTSTGKKQAIAQSSKPTAVDGTVNTLNEPDRPLEGRRRPLNMQSFILGRLSSAGFFDDRLAWMYDTTSAIPSWDELRARSLSIAARPAVQLHTGTFDSDLMDCVLELVRDQGSLFSFKNTLLQLSVLKIICSLMRTRNNFRIHVVDQIVATIVAGTCQSMAPEDAWTMAGPGHAVNGKSPSLILCMIVIDCLPCAVVIVPEDQNMVVYGLASFSDEKKTVAVLRSTVARPGIRSLFDWSDDLDIRVVMRSVMKTKAIPVACAATTEICRLVVQNQSPIYASHPSLPNVPLDDDSELLDLWQRSHTWDCIRLLQAGVDVLGKLESSIP